MIVGMYGRTLATVERVVCIYTPDSDDAMGELESWIDSKEDIDLTTVPIGDSVTEDDFERSDETLGISLGGDGAFLEGVREFSKHNIPLLGVNTGTLAFLARVSPSDLQEALDEILQGRARVASRQRVNLEGAGVDVDGINDIIIQPVPPEDPVDRKIASLHAYVDDEYVGQYTGSGLAVSTPTGSTGISLSAQGPIHYPSNNLSLQIVPLHTHKMGVRPIILSSESTVTIVPENEVQVLVDGGRHSMTVDSSDRLTISGAESRAHIIRTSNDDEFFNAMTKKLGWGIRNPDDGGPLDDIRVEDEGDEDMYGRARRIAVEAAQSASEKLRDVHGDVDNVQYKGDKSDMVTEADYQSQKILKTTISNEFPEHTVLSEEEWEDNAAEAKYQWLLDPLDGTGNFMHGNPNYSISIALLEDGEPVVAVVYQPETDEYFSAIRGRGAYADGHKISVSNTKRIDESMMLSGYDPSGDFVETFYDGTQGIRAIGSTALNLCYIASGAADASWEFDTYPWDVAAGILILREAGGKVTNTDCENYELSMDSAVLNRMVASNGRIHTEVCSKIRESDITED